MKFTTPTIRYCPAGSQDAGSGECDMPLSDAGGPKIKRRKSDAISDSSSGSGATPCDVHEESQHKRERTGSFSDDRPMSTTNSSALAVCCLAVQIFFITLQIAQHQAMQLASPLRNASLAMARATDSSFQQVGDGVDFGKEDEDCRCTPPTFPQLNAD